MALIPIPVPGKQKSADLCRAFIAGAPRSATGYVFFGANKSNVDVWNRVLAEGADYYYGDNSYFDETRGSHFRFTKNAIQVSVSDRSSDGRRFKDLGICLQPWQNNAQGHYVLIEQSPSFMSEVCRRPTWFQDTLKALQGAGRALRVRGWDSDKAKLQKSLGADLIGAYRLVTYCSAAATTALIHGIPIETGPASSYYPYNSIDRFDREPVLSILADHQWLVSELESGKAWDQINKKKKVGSHSLAVPATGLSNNN